MSKRNARSPFDIMRESPPGRGPVAARRQRAAPAGGSARGRRSLDAVAVSRWFKARLTGGRGAVVAVFSGLRARGPAKALESVTSTQPVTVNVAPRWVTAGAAGAVVVLLVTLTVVWQMGRWSAIRDLDDQVAAANGLVIAGTPDLVPGGGDRRTGPTVHRLDPTPTRPPGTPQRADGGDPRVVGLNYLIYSTTSRNEAERLGAFLQGHEVDVLIDHYKNNLYYVVDVSRGFTADDLRTPAWTSFKADRLTLGRVWKEHNGSRGDDLSSMYLDKFGDR